MRTTPSLITTRRMEPPHTIQAPIQRVVNPATVARRVKKWMMTAPPTPRRRRRQRRRRNRRRRRRKRRIMIAPIATTNAAHTPMSQGKVFLEKEVQRILPQACLQQIGNRVQTPQQIHGQARGVRRQERMSVWGVDGRQQDKLMDNSIR